MSAFWPFFVLASASFQVVRNASQRALTTQLGLMGATLVRFVFGLPFALLWAGVTLLWRGPSGAPSAHFFFWVAFSAALQAAATAYLVIAMRGRAFAVATAFTKSEALGTIAFGALIIHDAIAPNHWIGAAIGSAGILAMVHLSVDRAALKAAASGVFAGLLFALSSVGARGASLAWGPDPWLGAAAALSAQLFFQTIVGVALMAFVAPGKLALMFKAWRACLAPGAAGGIASAFMFTAFALAPSAGAAKAVQLVDVIMAWGVSHRVFKERIRLGEAIGMALVVIGALIVVL
jgi:drug/metabolite transporter (DMT)-like permease